LSRNEKWLCGRKNISPPRTPGKEFYNIKPAQTISAVDE
jgi:hypothetical protein